MTRTPTQFEDRPTVGDALAAIRAGNAYERRSEDGLSLIRWRDTRPDESDYRRGYERFYYVTNPSLARRVGGLWDSSDGRGYVTGVEFLGKARSPNHILQQWLQEDLQEYGEDITFHRADDFDALFTEADGQQWQPIGTDAAGDFHEHNPATDHVRVREGGPDGPVIHEDRTTGNGRSFSLWTEMVAENRGWHDTPLPDPY